MPHRSIPQSLLDDAAFPIRVKLRVPEDGFGTFLITMLRWLREELGEGNFARHGADTIEGEALAIYFRQIEDALDFLAAFPEVTLADGTRSRGYKAQPVVPRERKAAGSWASIVVKQREAGGPRGGQRVEGPSGSHGPMPKGLSLCADNGYR